MSAKTTTHYIQQNDYLIIFIPFSFIIMFILRYYVIDISVCLLFKEKEAQLNNEIFIKVLTKHMCLYSIHEPDINNWSFIRQYYRSMLNLSWKLKTLNQKIAYLLTCGLHASYNLDSKWTFISWYLYIWNTFSLYKCVLL